MKKLTFIIIIITSSCKQSNYSDPTMDRIAETTFQINLNDGNKSTFIYVENNNDTLYVTKFVDSLDFSFKLNIDNNVRKKFRQCVLAHIQMQIFLTPRSETLHGKNIRLFVTQYNNKLEASYHSIGSYKDVSLALDSLIMLLKNQDKNLKIFLDN